MIISERRIDAWLSMLIGFHGMSLRSSDDTDGLRSYHRVKGANKEFSVTAQEPVLLYITLCGRQNESLFLAAKCCCTGAVTRGNGLDV